MFFIIFATSKISTSYHNKAICRRILSYMPSSEGIFWLSPKSWLYGVTSNTDKLMYSDSTNIRLHS